ncbi:MAG: glycosyltransferase family 2 protein [Methanobacterium formicicum]|uniref:glycosyltransferase family 2 protein n=1 Tax=Methanobacterium formicicum TaxID=2162 RepID=UPI0035313714
MSNESPRVSIIILNWNGWKDTLECLESIYQIDYSNYDVLVVDNASQDNSLEKIKNYAQGLETVESRLVAYRSQNKPLEVFVFSEKDYFNLPGTVKEDLDLIPSDKRIIILKNNQNHGYAQGNNLAIEFALKHLDPDYILILNNDTVVHEDSVKCMVNAAQKDEKIGAVTPKVYYYDYQGRSDVISHAGEKFNLYIGRGKRFCKNQVDKGQCNQSRAVDTIEGCSIFFKSEVLKKVGLFDPVYFAYWEDTDLCFRMRKNGYKLLYVPQAMIWHKIGVNWDSYFSYFVIYHYIVRNRLIFIWRFASTLQKATFILYFFFYLLLNIILMLVKENWSTFIEGFKAIKNGIKDFRAF